MAISGDTAVVGAHIQDGSKGAAYVFVRDGGGNWIEQAKLLPSDGAADQLFGFSVAISGDTVIVGASTSNGSGLGSAYVFVMPAGGWDSVPSPLSEDAKLLASDGLAGDDFGIAVAIDGDAAVVGARLDTVSENQQGSAYVFVMPAGGWDSMGPVLNEDAKLLSSDPARLDAFGLSVAVSGDTVFVGTPADDSGADADENSGSVHVFVEPAGGWDSVPSPLNEDSRLLASDSAPSDNFGVRVAAAGDTVIVGANLDDDNGGSSGSAYVFMKPVGGWDSAAAGTREK